MDTTKEVIAALVAEGFVPSRRVAAIIEKHVRPLEEEIARMKTSPPGYPEGTSAIIRALGEPHAENLLRVMHANEETIAGLARAYKAALEKLHADRHRMGTSPYKEVAMLIQALERVEQKT